MSIIFIIGVVLFVLSGMVSPHNTGFKALVNLVFICTMLFLFATSFSIAIKVAIILIIAHIFMKR